MNKLKYIFMVLLDGIMYGSMSLFVKLSYAYSFNASMNYHEISKSKK